MKMLFCLSGIVLMLGCEMPPSNTAKFHDRQDQALRDPMNYSPNAADRTDISGGGSLEFKKDAFRRDLDSVINP